jgi:hypothetical protein
MLFDVGAKTLVDDRQKKRARTIRPRKSPNTQPRSEKANSSGAVELNPERRHLRMDFFTYPEPDAGSGPAGLA